MVVVEVVCPPTAWLRVLDRMVPREPQTVEVIVMIDVSTAGSAQLL